MLLHFLKCCMRQSQTTAASRYTWGAIKVSIKNLPKIKYRSVPVSLCGIGMAALMIVWSVKGSDFTLFVSNSAACWAKVEIDKNLLVNNLQVAFLLYFLTEKDVIFFVYKYTKE